MIARRSWLGISLRPMPERVRYTSGANFYDTRLGTERAKRNHVQHLEALGYKVTLEPTAA